MSEQPQQMWLERLLAVEAELAIADDVDLWPEIARRLHKRRSAGSTSFSANGVLDAGELDPPTKSSERQRLPFSACVVQRTGELAGAAVSIGLAVFVIVVTAIVASRLDGNRDQTGFENHVPEQVMPAASTPRPDDFAIGDGDGPVPAAPSHSDDARLAEPEPALVAGPDCTLDLDITLQSGTDGVYIPVRARSNWGCPDTGTVRLTIIDASGTRAAIAGNPMTIPLVAEGSGRRSVSTVVWSNWCGERDRFRIETRYGDEQRTHSLPDAPRCVNAKRPSTIQVIRRAATPGATETLATPNP